jgi:hypothetical protein
MSAKEYGVFFETLTQETPLEAYQKQFSSSVYFEDPFHKINGIEALYEVFQSMYRNLHEPRFVILDVVENETQAYLRWEFYFALSSKEAMHSFEGVSRVLFDHEGRVSSHVDYWDAASHIYEKLPIIGTFLRFVKNKIKAG